jgi:hypothetical protein
MGVGLLPLLEVELSVVVSPLLLFPLLLFGITLPRFIGLRM